MVLPILNCVEFFGDLVGDVPGWLGDLLVLVRGQAGDVLAGGPVECSLKVISGSQQGLSLRWRSGVAAVSPGRLDFTRGWWSFSATGPLAIIAVLGPARPPPVGERMWLSGDCRIAELQTPTATLGWAVPVRYLPWALEHLQKPACRWVTAATAWRP